ncbi:8374_t:CDS:1 [Ambispora leptoticha]|uniref:8374_t:CDS:1 n=1 Tax=Ambispora leptoticha TaxID=144679 RepID=A0A9N9AHH0_9GLOM|nr:8374_t:CDS:1 [Ambispora leptoticha]
MDSCEMLDPEIHNDESNQILHELITKFDLLNQQLVDDDQLAALINTWLEENRFDATNIFKLVCSNIEKIRTPSLLGIFYSFGIGTPRNEISALRWFDIAAKLHDPLSQCMIGQWFQDQHDFNRAFHWYKLSATQNHPHSQFLLASLICVRCTDNIEHNQEKAFEWMLKAASKNHLKAQYFLGNFYYHGTGIPSNYEKAFSWYKIAASRGHEKAINEVAECYERGCGTVCNTRKAFYWYLKAASFNGFESCDSKLTVAEYYNNGFGTEKDIHQKLKWYRRASRYKSISF